MDSLFLTKKHYRTAQSKIGVESFYKCTNWNMLLELLSQDK